MSLDIKLGSYQFGDFIDTFEVSQESRVEQVAIPRRHGYLSDVGYKTGIRVRVGGLIYNDDYNDTRVALNLLKNAFNQGKANLTVFSDKQLEVQRSMFSVSYEDQDLRRMRWEAELVSDDYGFSAVNGKTIVKTISSGGNVLLETGDNLLLESGDKLLLESVSEVVTNDGNLDVYPIIRIAPGAIDIASGLAITNVTTGKYFTFNQLISVGDYIEIDTDLLTVKNSAGVNKLTYFTGDFFPLVAGDNVIQWAGTQTGSPTMTFIYRDKYDGQ